MFSRREVIRALGALPFIPHLRAQQGALDLDHRALGRTGRWVTPLGLGGQASLQWTAAGIDPADIIVRAVELGVNYLDSANAYGPSQANYGEAFRRLHLSPADAEYNAALRDRLYLASKTGQRYARTTQANAATAIRDLRTSMTTFFGDGRGFIPQGAYIDCFQIHNLSRKEEVDQIYEGVETRGGKMPDRIGALAGLLDFRDGANYTGLNPEGNIWIRHIGITGHQSSPVLMYALQRDELNIIDTVLVGVNANDRRAACHQNNVIPLARAKGLGIIAMKVLADGVFYGKEARFSRTSDDVIRAVGKPGVVDPYEFIRYPLAIPGVSVAIIGIGAISRENPAADQLVYNLSCALASDPPSAAEMRRIESDVATVHGINTNYFNERRTGITQPASVSAEQDGDRVVVKWDTAFAGPEPIRAYDIYAGEKRLLSIPYRPQTTLAPHVAWISPGDAQSGPVRVVASGST
jgi:aryl-alcohol dehydrogenase-like predicted oxidoreductase